MSWKCGTIYATGLAFCLLSAGCIAKRPPDLAQCGNDTSYVGPALRDPVALPASLADTSRPAGLSPSEVTGLGAAFDTAFSATRSQSMTAAVWQNGGPIWTQQAGVEAGQMHYWASVGKIVTAATIVRLADDGQLSLDDPIAKYIAGVPSGDVITLRMLLTHTSGLFSANEDPQVRARGTALTMPALLDLLIEREPYACPGTNWRYSNSGYTLLGAIIEQVTDKPYYIAATDLILSRSRAPHLRILAPDDSMDDIVPPSLQRAGSFNPTHPQAAGGIIADASSMVIFLQDLFDGRILPRALLLDMFQDLYPMADTGLWYGQGVMAYDVPNSAGSTLWLGHSGGVSDAQIKAVAAYVPARNAVVAVALVGDSSAEATANLLLSALED